VRLVIRAFGLDLLDVELTTDPTEAEYAEHDAASILSGGTLGAYPIDAGPTDRYMGFTSGLGDGDE
jgi:hypothetical protein